MSKDYLFQEIIVKNPVLIGTIGLCPIVAICTSLKAALIMSVITILTLIIAQALSSMVLRHLPQWLRMSLYMLVGMLVVAPSMLVVEKLDPTTMLALGIYLPLLSVNPVIVRQCEREGVNIGLAESLINSLCAGVGYSLVLIIVGIVRELFGNGTIWGVEVLPFAPAAGMLMPMGGFIVLAFMAALLRAYFKKIDPAYAEELAVNSRTAIKGHKGLKSLLIEVDDDVETKSFENDVSDTDAVIDEILADVVAEREMGKESIYNSADTEFAEETSPIVASKGVENEPKKFGDFFDKLAKKTEKSEDERQSKKAAKTSKKQDKNAGKRPSGKAAANKPTNVAPTEQTAMPEVAAKPKFEFITLELPSAVKKAEEKAAAEKAAAERAAEKAAAEKLAAEKLAAEKAPAEKRAAEKHAAGETLARERVAAEKAARAETETDARKVDTAFAAPVSEEEAKAETSTEKRNHASNIVYRSQELERLMSMSLEDILNGLPTDGEESEK